LKKEYTGQYCEESVEIKNKIIALRIINYTRLYKRMFLAFKLVGIDRDTFINAFRNTKKYSAIK